MAVLKKAIIGVFFLVLVVHVLYAQSDDASHGQVDLASHLRQNGIEFAKTDFHGFEQFNFQVDGVDCKIVQPTAPINGRPWIWRARFWGHEPQLDVALLNKGWSVCYCDVGGLFGNAEAIERWNRFYEFTQEVALGDKPFLEGMSRGGLIIMRWAAESPDKVAGIYADNAVMDFRSWPGGKGIGKGAPLQWKNCLAAYELTDDESKSFEDGPLDRLQPIVDANIPIIALINEADKVVPPSENGDLLVEKFGELGGNITEIRREGLGHHPHSLKDPAVLVEFAEKAIAATRAVENEINVECIWNESPHNAFTDIIRWNDKFYCTFRTGKRHVHGDEGKIQLLESTDGDQWNSIAHLSEDGIDLRDPKLSITPGNRLMLLFGGSEYVDRELRSRATRVAFIESKTDRAQQLTELAESMTRVNIDAAIKSGNDWLWRVTWHGDTGYGVAYQPGGYHLLKTTNGVDYELLKSFQLDGRPNESTIRFTEAGQMRIVARNEETGSGHLLIGERPYEEFKIQTIPVRLGGPNMIQLPGGTWILGTRQYGDPTRTVLGTLAEDGAFERLCELPSAGDTSYPGMLIHENKLWVSYYSSHEGKTSVYLTKIPLTDGLLGNIND